MRIVFTFEVLITQNVAHGVLDYKGYRPHLHVVHSFVVLALGHMVRHMYTVSQSLIGR